MKGRGSKRKRGAKPPSYIFFPLSCEERGIKGVR
jgi:hypothetical protein